MYLYVVANNGDLSLCLLYMLFFSFSYFIFSSFWKLMLARLNRDLVR